MSRKIAFQDTYVHTYINFKFLIFQVSFSRQLTLRIKYRITKYYTITILRYYSINRFY